MTDVVIIGAGPYGLSIGAYLNQRGVDFRIFGNPMLTWRTQMPAGMMLKSEGFASSLFDPRSEFTLEEYCKRNSLPYADIGMPVPLETFSAYGMEFQKRFVPQLENQNVEFLNKVPSGFEIRLSNGGVVAARRIVVAVGISYFANVPPILSQLSCEYATHSSRHSALGHFRGRDVTILGGGSSALDLAALLLDTGAAVRIVARKPVLYYLQPPGKLPRPFIERVKAPTTGLGPSWRNFLCTNAPLVFRLMPDDFRLTVVRKHLGPSGPWWVREQIETQATLHLGHKLTEANVKNGRVELRLATQDGTSTTVETDHVIAATGYRPSLERLTFLDPSLRKEIRALEDTPMLSSNFESSVPGLYFVGLISANTFGPLVRFAYGAEFTANRLSRRLKKSSS